MAYNIITSFFTVAAVLIASGGTSFALTSLYYVAKRKLHEMHNTKR